MSYSISFPSGLVNYYFDDDFDLVEEIIGKRKAVFITDSNVHSVYHMLFEDFNTIIIPAGESSKNLETINYVTEQLIRFEADRNTILIGVGGGVVTDITGFVGSIYMRGVTFGLVPTSLLAMVDAAVGGKNGINFDLHKNMLGTIRQPEFILYDNFLHFLPEEEWSNGFAEVIKYACIFDSFMFDELLSRDINFFRLSAMKTKDLVKRCVDWKNKMVLQDESEQGIRKLLNFGHTVGHALEKVNNMKHGYAISIGMNISCMVSEKLCGFNHEFTIALKDLLVQYKLPTQAAFNSEQVMSVLRMDKKRNNDKVDFIVLERFGKARVETISFDLIHETLNEFLHAGNH